LKAKEDKEKEKDKEIEKEKDEDHIIRTVSYDQLSGLISPKGDLYRDSYSTHYPLLLKGESEKDDDKSSTSDDSESDTDNTTEKEKSSKKHNTINKNHLEKDEDGKYPVLNQMLAFDGADCSPGFAQTVALARLYVRHSSKIIILDEAMSQIDPLRVRNIILPSLYAYVKGKNICLIIITTNLVTIGGEKVDHIYVVDKGKVVHSGTHEELVTDRAEMYLRLMNRS